MSHQSVGKIIDDLGVTLELLDTQRVTECFVLGKVMDLATGNVFLVMGSNNLDWVAEEGLVSAGMKARDIRIAQIMQSRDKSEDE